MTPLRSAARPSTRLLRHWQQRGLHAQSLVVPHRFALWPLRPLDSNSRQLLMQDQELLTELPTPPVARLLLPANATGPNAAQPFVYVPAAHMHTLEEILAGNTSPNGFFALSLLPHPPSEQQISRQPLQSNHQQPKGAIATQLLLSNALVNVWNFCVESQHTCELHEHLLPYVFINRSSGSTRNLDALLQDQGETQFCAGEYHYVDVDPSRQRCVHAFQNTGAQALQQYVVEFKS